eukprot:TRINITY_DN65016_c0_g1_i1.p1 TRINITY_DN65016_c0_g1~~TRINITY_DN65016_c0_g1_i1.p1  ORF type:complete len:542 (+),score=48.36 TRINITY_DN65016_c0_g1_i1:67-1692(+)
MYARRSCLAMKGCIAIVCATSTSLLLQGCGSGSGGNAPTFDLPFNDINVLIVTDTHSWIAGHKHEPQYDATYGDVLSFYERLQEDCLKNGRDLFFVMNGDINDGTGLSTDPPVELVPLLQRMPWDVVTVGNHELYKNEFIDYLVRPGGFVEHWGDRYLTANVVNRTTGKPIGSTHKFLHGMHGTTLLAFGFLYNMTDSGSAVSVRQAGEVVAESWFQNLVRGDNGTFDAILILGHMHYIDPYVDVILQAIRSLNPSVPVQFVTGHSHQRLYTALDNASSSFEAGNYLNTVGFASFPTKANALMNASKALAKGFSHVFIDGNVESFRTIAGMENISTHNGTLLAHEIQATREKMGLTNILGCSPLTYQMYAPLNETDSLWALILDSVLTSTVFQGNRSNRVFVQSTGSARYDLYAGELTKNDIITVSPFADEFWLLSKNVSGKVIAATMKQLNLGSTYALQDFVSTRFDEDEAYEVYSGTYDTGAPEIDPKSLEPGTVLAAFEKELGQALRPTKSFEGTTTTNMWYEFVPKNWPCSQEVTVV